EELLDLQQYYESVPSGRDDRDPVDRGNLRHYHRRHRLVRWCCGWFYERYYRVVSHERLSDLGGHPSHPCFRHSHRRLSRVWNCETGVASVYYDAGHADSSAWCRTADHEWCHHIDHKRHVYRVFARRFSRGTQSFLDGGGGRRSRLHLPAPKPV